MWSPSSLNPVPLILLATLACGPPPFEPEPEPAADASTGGADSTDSADSQGSETEAGDDSSTDGDMFLPRTDVLVFDDCDSFAQDCPEGEKCVPYASSGGTWDANKCVPIMGEQATGEPCTYAGAVEVTDDCDATGMCWDVTLVDDEWIGVCRAFCTGSPDSPGCPPASACTVSGSGVINICIPTCDPTVQDCAPGLACFWVAGDFSCISATQDIPAGEPCGFINDCAAGLGCFAGELFPACEGPSCCSPFCDLGLGDGPCDAVPGTSCVAFFEEDSAPPEYEHVGVCLVL